MPVVPTALGILRNAYPALKDGALAVVSLRETALLATILVGFPIISTPSERFRLALRDCALLAGPVFWSEIVTAGRTKVYPD